MPYCSGCGSRHQDGDKVCKSCGYEIVADKGGARKSSPTALKKAKTAGGGKKPHPKRKIEADPKPEAVTLPPENTNLNPPATPPEVPTPPTVDKRQLQSEPILHGASINDVHLGKGIIKPKAVEIGIDGYHFKYEDQPHHSKKMDNWIKEQSKEYRVINPDFESEPAVPEPLGTETERSASVEAPEMDIERTIPRQEDLENQLVTAKSVLHTPVPLAVLPEAPNAEDDLETLLQQAIEAEMRDLDLLEDPQLNGVNELKSEEPTPHTEPEAENAEVKPELGSNAEQAEKSAEPVREVSGETGTITENGAAEVEEISRVPEIITESESSGKEGAENAEPLLDDSVASTPQTQKTLLAEPLLQTDTPEPELAPTQSGSVQQPVEPLLTRETLPLILWEGKQSWFGIPLPNQIRITEELLILTEQSGHQVTIEFSKIVKVTVKQSWLTKFLGIGDLALELRQQVPSRQTLNGIANPGKVRALLEERIKSAL